MRISNRVVNSCTHKYMHQRVLINHSAKMKKTIGGILNPFMRTKTNHNRGVIPFMQTKNLPS